MSFLRRLLGGSGSNGSDGQGLERHLDYLNTLHLPAIALSGGTAKCNSRIGGMPWLPSSVTWPKWKSKSLAFLCQLDLEEVPDDCNRQGLPSTGMLYFFYDQEQETWGFDPEDEGSWQVIYAAEGAIDGQACDAPHDLEEECICEEIPITFSPVKTYPDWQDKRIQSLKLNDEQDEQYGQMCSGVFGGQPEHHLFGYPSPVQGNNMDLDCQLVSHGLYCGDETGYRDPRVKTLLAGRRDWILFLQLDTDDNAGMMWGDCGRLYFWIRKQDLEEGRFDKCWMILQCG